MADAKLQRELKIKSGVLKRYLKEVEYYRREVQKQNEKINEMKETPEQDQYMIKKATEVLQENQNMVSLTLQNVKKASCELKSLLESNPLPEEDEQRAMAEALMAETQCLSM